MRNDEVFDYFSLDHLEGRDVLNTVNCISTDCFLEQDLSLLNEDELVGILTKKTPFSEYEEVLIKFWASLFKSKKLFEISIGNILIDNEFKIRLAKFIQTSEFKRVFRYIDWRYMFIKTNSLTLNTKMNFCENIAFAMATNKLLTIELIEKFNLSGVTWNHRGTYGETTLMHLCKGNPKLAEISLLLSKSVEINIQDYQGLTALMYLCRNEKVNLELLKLFVDNGADITLRNNYKKTTLMFLCTNRAITLEMIQLFLDNRVDLTFQSNYGETALTNLCMNSTITPKMIQLFLDNGVNVNNQNNYGKTALNILCENKSVSLEILKLFFHAKANTNIRDNLHQTAFVSLCKNSAVTIDMIRLFLDNGVDVNIQDKYGRTAFTYLCANKNLTIDMIQLLVDKNIDLTLQDEYGKIALRQYLNTGGKDKKILKLLD